MTKKLPLLAPYSTSKRDGIKVKERAKIPPPLLEQKGNEPTSELALLQLQYENLEIKYKHIQSLLKESQELVQMQAKEISVLKHAYKHTSVISNKDADPNDANIISYQEEQISELRKQNADLLIQLGEYATNLSTSRSLKSNKNSIRLESPSKDIVSPKPLPLPLPVPIVNDTIKAAKQELKSIDLILDEQDATINMFIDKIYKSKSKEFVVETVVDSSLRLDELEDDIGMNTEKTKVSASLSNKKRTEDRYKRSSRGPIWKPAIKPSSKPSTPSDYTNSLSPIQKSKQGFNQSFNSINSCRSPSPSKSMLIRERDDLEEELLAQYERMRKLESMEKIIVDMTKINK